MDILNKDKQPDSLKFLAPHQDDIYHVDDYISSKASLTPSLHSRWLSISMLSLAQQQLKTYAPNSASINNICKRLQAEGSPTNHVTDRGYCWVVLMSSFLLYLISLLQVTSSGMLYVELLDAFPGREQATLWACSLSSALQFLMGFVLALVSEKLGPRPTAMIGSAGLGLCLCISSFTTSYILWFIMYAVLAPLFSGLVLIPSTTATLKHFDKYKQTALMIVNCAAGITYFTFPPIVAQLISSYGWREVNIFLGFLSMQGVILAALIRPPQEKRYSDSELGVEGCISEGDYQQEIGSKVQMACPKEPHEINTSTEQKTCPSKLALLWQEWKPMVHWRMGVILGLAYIIGYNLGLFFVSVPYYVELYGVTPQGTAQLYMIGAIASVAVRILAAITGKFVNYDKTAASLTAILIMAGGYLALTIQPSFTGFAIACALVSVGTGLVGVLQTPVILELHGEYRVELVFGMFFTVTGVSGLIAPIFTEMLGKATGTMASGFWCCTAQSVAAAFLVVPHLVLKYSSHEDTTTQQKLDLNDNEKDF